MAIGRTNAGGAGGTALNFQVVGNPQPSNPKENTIWIDTNVPISSYVFSAEQPKGIPDMVWISTGKSSTIEFNALKKNSIQVYPISAKQYIDGAWVDKTAKSYQNGKWVDWVTYLYNTGNECNDITGGWVAGESATINKNTSEMSVKSGLDNGYRYVLTANKIDLTPYKTLHAIARIGSGGSSSDIGCLDISANGSTTSGNTKFTNTEYQEVTYNLDSVDGLFYIRIGDQGTKSSTFVKQIWLT